ncbi:hypothetical protein FIBSPDRAFT_476394 [Athelia psychrophila]|uniref:Steroid 5-alpha reductase C-terminal domain-containing protein n=1 Tax=Athelia psychrophila TaxID=1759441 RepID=A0A166L8D9_9AGAM|nr:hypothetical protein FIBSPDRAFT_476394 [Fibularhizoctonia sp. CBS 109695]
MQKLPVAGSYAALESAVKQSAVCVQNGDGDLVKVFGPQIGWKSVFLIECAGPLLITLYSTTCQSLSTTRPCSTSSWKNSSTRSSCSTPSSVNSRHSFCIDSPMAPCRSPTCSKSMYFVHVSTQTQRLIARTPTQLGTLPRLRARHRRRRLQPHPSARTPASSGPAPTSESCVPPTLAYLDTLSIYLSRAQWAELSNLHTHITSKNLRAVPHGYGFDGLFSVSFPNYFFELIGRTVIAGMTGSRVASAFAVVAGG